MKVVIQRVNKASVEADNKLVSDINTGLLIFLGIAKTDSENEIEWLVKKILNLRIFSDPKGKMNRSIKDIHGEILLISQFTLYGNCEKGRRPGFDAAAKPEIAEKIYEEFYRKIIRFYAPVKKGVFGADMTIMAVNDGPATFILERNNKLTL